MLTFCTSLAVSVLHTDKHINLFISIIYVLLYTYELSGTLALSSQADPFSSFIFLKVNVDLIDLVLKSSSSIKTPFIWVAIFEINKSFAMYFFTESSAPSITLPFIFCLSIWFLCCSSSVITSLFFNNWSTSFAFLSATSIFPSSLLWLFEIQVS